MFYTNYLYPATIVLTLCISISACSKKIIPGKPELARTNFNLDSLPDSELNIPIQVNLKPFFAEVNAGMDSVFTSPNWPNDWVNADCATRYKYHFRRGPLQFKASGLALNIGFTGYYQIIGSTRACAGTTVLTPWSPPCRCGFDEGERKVAVGFNNTIAVMPDYKIRMNVKRLEPQPMDKCTVCFWGQDITTVVMNGLKEELDLAKKNIEDSFGVIDLRDNFQQVWNMLNQVYNIYGLGWLKINPQEIRVNNLYAKNDSLNIHLGLSAKPVISFEKPETQLTLLPNLGPFSHRSGFNIFLDAVLNYDSLTNIVNAQLKDKEFELDKGPVKKRFIIRKVVLYGDNNENLVIKVDFGGSDEGVAYFIGKPVYDPALRTIEIKNLDFDVKTKALLTKTAGWLFNRRIINELEKYSRFDLGAHIDTAKSSINNQLNREIIKGITSYGNMDDIRLIGIYPLRDHLVIRSSYSGYMAIKVESVDFSF